MIAILFAKESRRLKNKHSMELCGETMVDRIARILVESGYFENIILFTRDYSLKSRYAVTDFDRTDGILIDSILYCIGKYHEFLAVGGDMPYIDRDITGKIVNGYEKHSIAYDSEGFCQPLFAIYSMDIYEPLKEYRRAGGESISNFIRKSDMKCIVGLSGKLKSVNTVEDLMEAREKLCIH
ncbi:MAG: molybdopterin-guanine dinucleotide biosynthesis protein A [Ferroplasma sp. Type II]|jgi:molybdopterin-guanine dinucleotide biosynthesis protein A|uniref:molybdenum cofactor guanylyltransferase n=1 Tax=Ferroplasma sp. Type II TaxID=261388 RepID=UPI00038942B8|nr:NTP transferase domain-containing protein [Ferroplasma sp. Type II]EQB73587.1 MAG: molybdopterin-guanine dinucleotide biosynthesis protein A [Ferroplasma sp. Type II]HIH60922.1 NTP transferase domain-containing protein [Ferroplasma sp.]HII81807.1 NTP transferase domain-containing protein [Ferroplasma sp.]